MKTLVMLAILTLPCTEGRRVRIDNRPWWRYTGPRGQEHWCCKGAHFCCGEGQSPLNIDVRYAIYDETATCLTFLHYHIRPRSMSLFNNGHTVELLYNAINRSAIPQVRHGPLHNSSSYILDRIHFHWGANSSYGSEHTLNYINLPLEMQLVHYNIKYRTMMEARDKRDGLLIVAVLFVAIKEDNNQLRALIYNLKNVKWNGQYKCIPPFILLDLLPPSYGFFYHYNGSLTAPPCYESVLWVVFHNPVCISEYQLNEFRKLQEETAHSCPYGYCNLVDNYRKATCIRGRIVKWKEECPPTNIY